MESMDKNADAAVVLVDGVQLCQKASASHDRVLLLVEWHSGTLDQQEGAQSCMQLVHRGEGQLGYCNTATAHACLICARPICQEHDSCIKEDEVLCENCSLLAEGQRRKLQHMRRLLEEEDVDAAV